MKQTLEWVQNKGAEYADFRIIYKQSETLLVKNQKIERHIENSDQGFGIRVLFSGHWGFACSFKISPEEFLTTAEKALKIAKSAAAAGGEKVVLAPQKPVRGSWKTVYKKDPFAVSKEEKIELLIQACREMQLPEIRATKACMDFTKEKKIFANTEGSYTEQEFIICGAGIEATAVLGEEHQVRSYPNSFGGNFFQGGYEFIEALRLSENAKKTAEEAVALLHAEQCPEGKKTIVLDSSQTALQIHESCGHPTELDRVLGMELGFAGGSFLTPDKLGKFQYGSKNVTIMADATAPTGIGTFGFDDEGVPAKKTPLIDKGRFSGYLSSRETVTRLGELLKTSRDGENFEEKSNGTVRAEGWNNLPLIRMTNINLEPGDWSLEEMIKETKEGLLLTTNRSWSIDDKRYNFQFGTEMAYEIKDGSLGKLYKNAIYTGMTPEFWNSCDAVASREFWQLWGLPNCGKGEPVQTMFVGHGASPARFQNVQIGVGKW